jgi:hypothetical protein
MSDTLIIILIIIAAWWSGLLPALLLIIVGIGMGILTVWEKVWFSNRFGPARWWLLKLSGAEDRRIRKAMQAHRRRHPRASLDQLMRYENSLRESRERNIRKRGR